MRLGKKHAEIAMRMLPSGMAYGGVGAFTLVYFTDWRVIADYIPLYNGKFKDES